MFTTKNYKAFATHRINGGLFIFLSAFHLQKENNSFQKTIWASASDLLQRCRGSICWVFNISHRLSCTTLSCWKQLCWDLKIGFVNVFLSTIWKAPLLFLALSTKTGASGKTNISSLWLCTSPAFSKVKGAREDNYIQLKQPKYPGTSKLDTWISRKDVWNFPKNQWGWCQVSALSIHWGPSARFLWHSHGAGSSTTGPQNPTSIQNFIAPRCFRG